MYQDGELLLISAFHGGTEWTDTVRIVKKEISSGYLLIEESKNRFVYLPKEVDAAIRPYGK